MAYKIKTYHGGYNISKRTQAVRYIVLHYVGSGTSASGSARANCAFFAGGNRNASANYFVDDANIYEYADPSKYATWHVGDGGGRYGITNGNSVGIEVCINGDVPYTDDELPRVAWLVQRLQAQFGVPDSRVVRHYDASRKACPYYYTPSGRGGSAAWKNLRSYVTGSSSKPSASKPSASKPTKKYSLKIDGVQGRYTNLALQEFLRSQRNWKGELCYGTGFALDGVFGSGTVLAWQEYLRTKGFYGSGLRLDGDFGYYTKLAAQEWLRTEKNLDGELCYGKGYKLDGVWGEGSVLALQECLRAKGFYN